MADASAAVIAVRSMDCVFDKIAYCEARGIDFERLQRYFFAVRALEYSFIISLGRKPVKRERRLDGAE